MDQLSQTLQEWGIFIDREADISAYPVSCVIPNTSWINSNC